MTLEEKAKLRRIKEAKELERQQEILREFNALPRQQRRNLLQKVAKEMKQNKKAGR